MARINIQIEGMSIIEAEAVMKALTRSVKDAETTAAVEHSKPKMEELVAKGKAQAAAEAVAEDTECVAESAPVEDDLPGDLGQDGKGPTPKAKPKAKAKAKPKEAPQTDNVVDLDEKREASGMVEKVAKFTKLVDIVETMYKDGQFPDEASVVAECERISDQVPALQRISDIPARVKRVLARISA